MKQVIQNFKSGELYVDDVPIPSISEGMILVENKFSLISAGTEKGTVDVGKASMIGKAKKRPDLVKQVIQNIKKEGLSATIDKVKTKLDSLKALGYSTSGIVVSSLDTNKKIKVGDRVACAGQDFASHSGFVGVPQNLVAKIPENVTFEEAAFTTIGAIALQGVRQAEPRLGDNICVIGLGLLGQITGQLLKANGCNVFGIDVNKDMIDLALKVSCDQAISRNEDGISTLINNFTNGYGFDSVIITAATTSNDPIEFSGEICRKKGKVIVVGDVNMNLPRNPYYYRKELDLRMSCSYGPGRYDSEYEDNGNDYPYAFVRYTEQRNMETFLKLISSGSLNIKPLISHIFEIEKADEAYNIVMGKTQEKFLGILLKYNEEKYEKQGSIKVNFNPVKDINVGFIGAGSFAQSYLIPNVKKFGASLDTVATRTGINSKNVASKFNFNNSSSDAFSVLENEKINTVFIATQHDTHFKYTFESLKNGKNVFVEKPLAMNYEELYKIKSFYEKEKNISGKLLVGFNRRFALISEKLKNEFSGLNEPLIMNFRVNAGFIPKEHWIQNEKKGGGRIIGEICHFVDLMQFYSNSDPIKVYADCLNSENSENKDDDNIVITIKFKNGSVGNLVYIANGDKSMPKERIEVSGAEKIFVINDWKDGELYMKNKKSIVKLSGKGHKQEVESFLQAVKEGKESPISFKSLFLTTLTTLKIVDSIKTGLPQVLEW